MTPEQLLRLAAQKTAAADLLGDDARRLRAQAAVLRDLLDPLVPMSQRVWAGPAATEFEGQVRAHIGRLNQQADVLDRIAGDFETAATARLREAADLRSSAAVLAASVSPGGVM